MIKQKWNISEEEKQRILNLHENATKKLYLIKEQTEQFLYTDNFGDNFESGKYELTPQFKQAINDKIIKLVGFIKGKNLKNFKIIITPGESQVTNQAGYEQVGSLAKERANMLKKYLEQVLPQMLGGAAPNIIVTSPVIGNTPYDKKTDYDKRNDQKYKNEQFVKVSVALDTETPQIPTPIIVSSSEPIYVGSNFVGNLGYVVRKSPNKDKIQGNVPDTENKEGAFITYQPGKAATANSIESVYIVPQDLYKKIQLTRHISDELLNNIKNGEKISNFKVTN